MATHAQPSTATHETTLDTTLETDLTSAVVEEDLLVEEVSIDGMCGVY